MSLTLTLTLIPILRYLSKQKGKKINREFINKILYNFEISTLVTKNYSHNIDALYTDLLYKIENIIFNIKKNSLLLRCNA